LEYTKIPKVFLNRVMSDDVSRAPEGRGTVKITSKTIKLSKVTPARM
jgi:hypothetical protein